MALGLALAAARDIPRGDSESAPARRRSTTKVRTAARSSSQASPSVSSGAAAWHARCCRCSGRFAASCWVTILARRRRRPCARRRAGRAVELFARSRIVFVLAPVTTENAGRSAERASRRWVPARWSCSSRAQGSSTGKALLDAADSGRIRAAIDVFPHEPIPVAERARATPGTISPRTGPGNVPEIWRHVGEMVADDLEALPPDGRRPACNVPTRRPSGGFARGRSAS